MARRQLRGGDCGASSEVMPVHGPAGLARTPPSPQGSCTEKELSTQEPGFLSS